MQNKNHYMGDKNEQLYFNMQVKNCSQESVEY